MKTAPYQTLKLVLVAGMLAGVLAATCSADIIYQDTFARGTAGPLAGSAPTTDNTGGGVTWTAGTGVICDTTNVVFNSNIAGEYPGKALLPLDWTTSYQDPKAQVDLQFVQSGDWVTLTFGDCNYYGGGMPAVLKLYGNGNVDIGQGPGWAGNFVQASFTGAGVALGWNRLRIEFSNSVGIANFYLNGNFLTNVTIPANTWGTGVGLNYSCGQNVFATNFLVTFGNEATFPPTIPTQPVGETVFVGDPISLTMAASGTLPLQYTWCKNGAPIPGPNANTFNISAAAMSDTGDYTVVITNAYGAKTTDIAHVAVHLEAQSPLAQINFDDQTNNLYEFGFTYSSDPTVNLPVTWGNAPGDGVSGSTGFAIVGDGSAFASASVTYSGLGGGVGLALPKLATYNLDFYEAYFSAKVENLNPGVTNTPGRAALRFYIPNPTNATQFIDVLDVQTSLTYSSNYQTSAFVLNSVNYGGAAGWANFAQNYSNVTRVQFEFTLDNFYTDFVNGPGDAIVLDNIKLAYRHSPPISAGLNGTQTVLQWADPNVSLQGAASVTGPYVVIPGATSAYPVPGNSPYQFFRTSFQPVP